MKVVFPAGMQTPWRPRLVIAAALLACPPVCAAAGGPAPQNGPPDCTPYTITGQPTRPLGVSRLPVARVQPAAPAPYGGRPVDVPTFHNDNARTGWNNAETDLTPASLTARQLGLIATLSVDGAVQAQPLVISGFTLPDASVHDILLIATSNDSLYAFDARTYAVLWRRSLLAAGDATHIITAQKAADVGVGIQGNLYGVFSTPVIVRNNDGSARIYVVAHTETTTPAVAPATKPTISFHDYLHAVDLGTGLDLLAPTEITATGPKKPGHTFGFDPLRQQSRPGLAYADGSVYVAIGSRNNDAGSFKVSGWLLRYDSSLKLKNQFQTISTYHKPPTLDLGSVWMSGYAPAIDDADNVYFTTGNGDYEPALGNYGESLLKLSPTLTGPLGSFTPSNVTQLNINDGDLAAGGVMLIPAPSAGAAPLAVAIGKDPIIYAVNQAFGATPVSASYRIKPTIGQGVWGGGAYFNGPAGPTVFYQMDTDVLRSFTLSADGSTLTAAAVGTVKAAANGGVPVVSSNGAAGGLVWVAHRTATLVVEAYDAGALGAPIVAINTGVTTGGFASPTVANGRVYVGGVGAVAVLGLTK